MAQNSKILIIGGTGYLGKFIVEASIKAGHPTFLLVRDSLLSDPAKSTVLEGFKGQGVHLIQGDIYDHERLVRAVKQVDVVISTVGGKLVEDQIKVIAAIKKAGNVKRFIPSHWVSAGMAVDGLVEPAKSLVFKVKAEIMRIIEAERIPYTCIACNCFSGQMVADMGQPDGTTPPKDKVVIYGDGSVKAIFNAEKDIATYAIKSIDDPRTLNKILQIRPLPNILSLSELVSLWERKVGKELEKIHMPEDQLLQLIQEASYAKKFHLAILHAVYIKGAIINYESLPSGLEVDATELYPEVKYTTVDEFLDQFV